MGLQKTSASQLKLKKLGALDEIPEYRSIIESFFSESRFSDREIDWDAMERSLKMAIAAEGHSAIFVIVRDEKLIALALPMIMPFIGVPGLKLAQIQFMHVLPDFRKTFTGGKSIKLLLQAIQTWAKENGAVETSFDIETKYLSDQLAGLVAKQGFRQRAARFSDGERI